MDKIQYRLNAQANWADAPARLNIAPGAVEFKAIKTPADAAWPPDKPAWSGSLIPAQTGETIVVNINREDNYTLTAECGNVVSMVVSVTTVAKTYEYRPGSPITAGPLPDVPGASIPYEKVGIQASAGEPINFNVFADDRDEVRETGQPNAPWGRIPGQGPYSIDWAVSIGASFSAPNAEINEFPTNTANSGTVRIFIDKNWTGAPITVTATVKDSAPATAPNGSVKDPDFVITWTIVARVGPAPKTIKWVGGAAQGVIHDDPTQYVYKVGPDIGAPGGPDYEKQTVLETFDNRKANGFFTKADLKPEWQNLAPTADEIAALIFTADGNIGSFVIDNADQIYDNHEGFIASEYFTEEAMIRGIGFRESQHYSADGVILGTYILDHKLKKIAGLYYTQTSKTGP